MWLSGPATLDVCIFSSLGVGTNQKLVPCSGIAWQLTHEPMIETATAMPDRNFKTRQTFGPAFGIKPPPAPPYPPSIANEP